MWGYINYKTVATENGSIKEKNEKWISESHPDFFWKKYAKENSWKGKCKTNPNINANNVYKMYKHSMDNDNSKILEL